MSVRGPSSHPIILINSADLFYSELHASSIYPFPSLAFPVAMKEQEGEGWGERAGGGH